MPEWMHLKYEDYAKIYESFFNPEVTKLTNEEIDKIMPADDKINTSVADYVWLPIRFDGEIAYIDWKDEWRIEDYE
jgi:hypothetical protein